jgi:hypothetical protein
VLLTLTDDCASGEIADAVDHGNEAIPVIEVVLSVFVECPDSVRIVL